MSTLALGTLKCPKDKETLHFECFGGMRLKTKINRESIWIYKARCPKCNSYFDVSAPKEST